MPKGFVSGLTPKEEGILAGLAHEFNGCPYGDRVFAEAWDEGHSIGFHLWQLLLKDRSQEPPSETS